MKPSPHIERTNGQLPHVLFAQPAITHYRLPIFDGLAQRCQGRYTFSVYGPMDGDQAFGGGQRDYLHNSRNVTGKWLGFSVDRLPEIHDLVSEQRPDALVISLSPRCRECYTLPKICRQSGIQLIGWTKIHSFGRVPKFIMNPLRKWLWSGYDRIICYGHASAEELNSLGYPKSQTDIARNTIDTRRVFENAEEIANAAKEVRTRHGWEEKKILLSIARFDAAKRHRDLLVAWPKLREMFPDAILVLPGGGPLQEDIKKQAEVVDADRIFVVGRVPEGMDYAWIAAADVNLQCGAVGLAINQSMALGVPTVIADEWGVDAELIEAGITGWRYERGNIDALVSTIAEVFANPEETRRRTAAARTMMRDEVTIDRMVSGIDGCIRKALNIDLVKKEGDS